MTSVPVKAIEVFYSYAHKDESLRNELVEHLSSLHRQGYITEWYDRQILAGSDWSQAIDSHLESASVILLLISASFIASDYCYGREMQRALERHRARQAQVIPIILRPVDCRNTPFAALQFLPTNGRAITTWSNRDKAFLDVAQGLRKVIEGLSFSPISSPSSSQQLWNVPYPRNPLFTGREGILEHLAKALTAGQTAALTQPQAISGLGGIGKTQTAIEYAYRFRENYQAVLWARADTRDNLVLDYVALARLLQLPEQHQQDQPRIVEAVKRWLCEHQRWLLILDNADDLVMARDFLPGADTGHLLLTTRAQIMGRLAQRIELDRMEPFEGALFLLRRAGALGVDDLLDHAAATDQTHAASIVQVMGGLPLALDQAGAYIEETGCGLAGYLTRYQQRQADLLAARGGYASDHPEPVAMTWSLSFEKVEQANPTAAQVLCFCAFLAPDAIPEELITQSAATIIPELQAVASDPFALDAAIKVLFLYSLIQRDAERKLLSLHRLVQAVLKEAMDKQTRQRWAEWSVRAVNHAFPHEEFAIWGQCRRLLPHAQVCAELIAECPIEGSEASSLLMKAGNFLRVHAQYSEAGPLLQRALSIGEKTLGPDHPDVAIELGHLGVFYQEQGKYAEAEPLLKRALAIGEKTLDPNHREMAIRLNNLGMLYQDQGKLAEAEPLIQRALAINEKTLGPNHPDIAIRLNNLAALYYAQGKLAEAEPLLQRALAINEKTLDPDHPDVAIRLNNLAQIYQTQGKLAEAEPLLQRALAIGERTLDPDHPKIALRLSNLGLLYQAQGKLAEAEILIQRALAINEKSFGPDHPDVAIDLGNLGLLYQAQGKFAEAEILIQRARKIKAMRKSNNPSQP